ncbi:UNVERIFIED_CONTAM: hypothetical protein PYX00_003359 [Menopon gallinae]|uniref:Exonuclease domain-containing protein n=1 Tax=Menopon gallinae TaxID=328185 RepID=A0AAW2I064_9NEOP
MVNVLSCFFGKLRSACYRTMVSKLNQFNVKQDYFVWIDLEMTGLDVNVHKIIEVACIITDTDLNMLHEGIRLVVHQPQHVFDNECSEWPKIHHGQSGLIEESLKSDISVEKADSLVSDYIKSHTDYGRYYLSGNSVYMDKRFLEKYMPLTDQILHYRLVDVSCLKTLCRSWYDDLFKEVTKKNYAHRAFEDINESIQELKEYREKFFIRK